MSAAPASGGDDGPRGGRFLAIGECMVEMAPAGDGLFRMGFAGDTFNTAWYARRLLPADWSVGYATAVGDDAVSRAMRDFMAGEGIDTAAVRCIPGRTVGLYMIRLEHGERSFSYWRGQSAARALADDIGWLDRTLAAGDLLFFSGITLAILGPEGRTALAGALARARAAGAQVAFDTNLRPRLWESEAAMRAGLTLGGSVADIVLPSFDEETALFGDARPEATVARYRDLGAGLVAVKNGEAATHVWSAREGARSFTPPRVARIV
ncbi:MAG: sugar kinase, partial [Thermohalobaculum sp.]|nr:sugar kinase [Thermohalobaculum sp.]